jgi:ArsR family transcriptional regulator
MKALPVLQPLCCGPDVAPLDERSAAALATYFRALADPTRVAIVSRLAAGACCVCDLNESFTLSQPTISHHLKVLKDAGLVTSTRSGTSAYYRLVPEALDSLRGALAA